MSEKRTSASKKAVVGNVPAGSGKKAIVSKNYTGYFYNQIERLWAEIKCLQEENNKLRAPISGGP